MYYLDRVAQSLKYPCKQIAVETDIARLRWCHAEHTLLIGDHGSKPATIRDAQLMTRDRKSDISQLVIGLDLAFILTGLNGTAGKGVTSVVAEALAESGIFTIAITPGHRDVEVTKSLQRLVDVGFEVPYDVLMNEARSSRRSTWRELVSAAIAQICRVITFSLAKSGPAGIDAEELRSVLKGDSASVVGYGNGDGVEGCLAAFDAASTSPLLGADRMKLSRGLMVSIEARPGILKDSDIHLVMDKTREIAWDRAKLRFRAYNDAHLDSDYRVTILSRG